VLFRSEKNESPGQDKAQYQAKLRELISRGESIIKQFRKDKSVAIDYAKFIIPVEYYGQRLEDKAYLMPKENLGELMRIVQDDLTAFGEIAKSNRSRAEKFRYLINLVHSKSVYDPGALLTPSLLIPEGGQSCATRAIYKLILASHFAKDLLEDGEEFVIAAYTTHYELGIFNNKLQTVHEYLGGREYPRSKWSANLYHPAALVAERVNHYGKTHSQLRDFLVAEANEVGLQGKIEIKGPQSPLSFGLPSKYSSVRNDSTLERSKADSGITAKRAEKVIKKQREKLFRLSGILPIIQNEAGEEFTIEIISLEAYEKMMKTGERYKMLKEFQAQAQLTDEEMMKRVEIDENGDITNLDLIDIPVSDAGLVHIKGLTKLQGLNLSNTRVSDAGLAHIKGLPLQELYLTNTQVSDAGLAHIKNLPLRVLSLVATRVSDAGLVHIKDLPNLQVLYLSDTRVSDAGLAHIKGLTNLKTLSSGDTQAIKYHIKELKRRGIKVIR
jgi:hypothetical protein